MKRVFSGVQPTGNITIGNYLGAIKQFVTYQEDNDAFYCVVDLHSITLPQDPKELHKNSLSVAAMYMAVGLDPNKCTIFLQSSVKEHAELGWFLQCMSSTGELSRMTQFKDKSRGDESAPTGLFTYPTLMAADILLYDTNYVPVGNDQKQHLELTRDLAMRFNNRFGETFVVPEYKEQKVGSRIMSLDDPTSKMSKSNPNEHSRICLLDSPNKVKKSLMRSTTDSDMEVRFDPENKAGVSNLLTIYSAFSGLSVKDLEKKYEGVGYGTFKKELVVVVNDSLAQIQDRYNKIIDSPELLDILKTGADRARQVASVTMDRVKKNMGFVTL
ncbi:MAG: tryptophan--tRNA ligase [Anaeromicrobium sp.]|jgi:tryptophanyl-tRNA synthetase|uniref:tryptophan--tRNA ligase n=1 Tax=Anaeromicrobium sp. TaxID=1929132 RepID=UPI0025D8F4BE|nr:tryptophan--tRNA ligase [Anaeromicrobium sp.]MCT4594644.1 tryptophan--tRNA ligase [Anaeromicrobium sp.]